MDTDSNKGVNIWEITYGDGGLIKKERICADFVSDAIRKSKAQRWSSDERFIVKIELIRQNGEL